MAPYDKMYKGGGVFRPGDGPDGAPIDPTPPLPKGKLAPEPDAAPAPWYDGATNIVGDVTLVNALSAHAENGGGGGGTPS
jgi:hypothetical protein